MRRFLQRVRRFFQSAPRLRAVPVESGLKVEVGRLEVRLAQLQAEREVLERLASLGPGSPCGPVLESLRRDPEVHLPEDRWGRIEAWFRSGP